jgi:hypothetical protein
MHVRYKIGILTQFLRCTQVIFRKAYAELGNPAIACSTINVEEHTDCKCGCDLEASSCSKNQAPMSQFKKRFFDFRFLEYS